MSGFSHGSLVPVKLQLSIWLEEHTYKADGVNRGYEGRRCVCVCMCSQRPTSSVSPQLLSTLFSKIISLLGLELFDSARLDWPVSFRNLSGCCLHLTFYMCSGDWSQVLMLHAKCFINRVISPRPVEVIFQTSSRAWFSICTCNHIRFTCRRGLVSCGPQTDAPGAFLASVGYVGLVSSDLSGQCLSDIPRLLTAILEQLRSRGFLQMQLLKLFG